MDKQSSNLRRALGQYPTGVTIVTARDETGEPVGVTANSFASVSLEPPLILWSIARDAHSAIAFADAAHFAINVLAEDQTEASNTFARRGADKFASVRWKEGEGGAPLIEGCLAQFECRQHAVVDGGDHLIIIGQVLRFDYDVSRRPLAFVQGSYAHTMPHVETTRLQKAVGLESGFLSGYLPFLLRKALNEYTGQFYPQMNARFRVSPEEWHVLSLIADCGALKIDALSAVFPRSVDMAESTTETLCDRRLVAIDRIERTISLTPEGEELIAQLFDFARSNEASFLSRHGAEDVSGLKATLVGLV